MFTLFMYHIFDNVSKKCIYTYEHDYDSLYTMAELSSFII